MAHQSEQFQQMAVVQLTDMRWKQGTVTEFLVAQDLAYTYVCSRGLLKLLWLCVLFGEGCRA